MARLCSAILFIFIAFDLLYAQSGASIANGNFSASSSEASLFEIITPENIKCDITIDTHNSNRIEGNYRIWAVAKDTDQENRFIKLIEVKLDERSGKESTIRLRVLAPRTAPWQGTSYSVGTDLEIYIPENFKIDLRSMNGDMVIRGPLKYVEVDCDSGSVDVSDVDGETNIKTSYADVDVYRLKGIINIESTYSNIIASDIVITDKFGLFSSSSGSLDFENITGPIDASTSNDDITVYNLNAESGAIYLRTNYGRIKGSNITGELVAETSHKPIELSDVYLKSGVCKFETVYSPINVDIKEIGDSHLLINNTYNAINLKLPETISSKLILNVDEGGKIHTKGLSIKPLVMDKTRLVGIVGDGIARIEANVNGIGEINIKGGN